MGNEKIFQEHASARIVVGTLTWLKVLLLLDFLLELYPVQKMLQSQTMCVKKKEYKTLFKNFAQNLQNLRLAY